MRRIGKERYRLGLAVLWACGWPCSAFAKTLTARELIVRGRPYEKAQAEKGRDLEKMVGKDVVEAGGMEAIGGDCAQEMCFDLCASYVELGFCVSDPDVDVLWDQGVVDGQAHAL